MIVVAAGAVRGCGAVGFETATSHWSSEEGAEDGRLKHIDGLMAEPPAEVIPKSSL